MILQALNSYYDRLSEDPNVDVARFGFSRQKIVFCVTLNPDGSLHAIDDIREPNEKKLIPRLVVVCGNSKPSGSGINPGFLWDNPTYLLGYKPDDPKPERTRQSFEAFRKRHLAAEMAVGDREFSATCRFLESWNPGNAADNEQLSHLGIGFGVFRIRGANHFVHERPAVQRWWDAQYVVAQNDAEPAVGQCLVSGRTGPLTRLHEPKIQGVWGAQTSGALIVSFNDSAYTSYGKHRGANAPVSEAAAFQYCTALNHLLRMGSPQRIQVGDTTTVFWTEKPTQAENLLPWVFAPTTDAEGAALKNEVHSALKSIAAGQYPTTFSEPDTPFYILGLSPNAARISVRFWLASNLGDLVDKLHRHYADLRIARSERDPEFPAAWQLIRETVRESKDIPPLLAGAVMRSILTGRPYPSMLFSSMIRRIRADREVRYLRVAAIKACLNRNTRYHIDPLDKELGMSLDPSRTEQAYQLGRLFAELQKTEEDAFPGINNTIKDRYFSAASATPASVFPRLIRLNQYHLNKLKKGPRVYHERRIHEIAGLLDGFVPHLGLRDQGLFAIGYYHQRQDMFMKKTETETPVMEQSR
jgi:CRISPR-associated protein Csd1